MHTSPFASAPHLPAPGGIARPLATTLLALAAMLGAGAAQAALSAVPSAAAPPGKEQVQQALSGLAVPFEKNQGQFDARVAFMAKTFAGAVFVTHDGEIVYSLPGKPLPSPADSRPSTPASAAAGLQTPPVQRGPGWRLTESLPGAQRLTPQGGQPAATQVSRFTPQGRFSAPTYQSVMIGQAWPGIALELAARGNNVEKLFHVAPGADARQIQVQLHGATGVRLADDGALVVGTGNGEVAYTAPVAWQDIGGQRVPVAVRYALQGAATAAAATGQPPVQGYGFALAAYDQRHPLVIDPLIQSTYLGGSGNDAINSLALASNGDVVVAGYTYSTNLPCTTTPGCANGAQPGSGGSNDGFVARLSGDLKTLRQSSYLGGSGGDIITSLALASDGDVIVAGHTSSTNLPCTSIAFAGCADGAQPGYSGGTWDGFVARLSGDLQTLLQSSYLGGSSFDAIASLALASNGDVVVAGETRSTNLPCTSTTSAGCANGAQPGYGGGGYDSFVARLSGDLKGAQPQTISFAAQSPASRPFVLNSQFALSPTATASSGLAVAYGSSTPTVCTVDSASGMVTMLAIGTCTVVANQAGNAHWLAAAVGQSIGIGAQTQWSGPGPGGSGTVQLAISGGSPTCTLQAGATGFNLNTPSTVQAAANLPTARPGASMPLGLFAFSATGCAGNTLTISITYPGANLSGLTPHKYGPATPGAAPSWFAHGAVSGNTVTYTVTDNGQGDNNAAPGVIEDPFAMLLLAAPPAGPHAIPTLGEWSLMLLSLLAAALGAGALRRRGPQAPGV